MVEIVHLYTKYEALKLSFYVQVVRNFLRAHGFFCEPSHHFENVFRDVRHDDRLEEWNDTRTSKMKPERLAVESLSGKD